MNINYELLSLDYSSKSIIINNDYIEIVGLDGSVTKINIKYIPQKYLLPEEEDNN